MGALTLGTSRLPVFRADLRRNVGLAVSAVALLTLFLSLHVLLVSLSLRGQALGAEAIRSEAQINGLILAAIVLMLVSACAFLFAVGVMAWSFATASPAPAPETVAPPEPRFFGHPPARP